MSTSREIENRLLVGMLRSGCHCHRVCDCLPGRAARALEQVGVAIKLADFGRKVLIEHRAEGACDVDSAWVEETAIECGLLEVQMMERSCGDNCQCAEWGDDFPVQCLRLVAGIDSV